MPIRSSALRTSFQPLFQQRFTHPNPHSTPHPLCIRSA